MTLDANTPWQEGTVETTVNPQELYEALEQDAEVFLNFFMGEQLEFDVPEFHKLIWTFMTHEMERLIAIAVPRGHAKTTLAKLVVIWYFLFTKTQFIVYLCNTADLAEKAVTDIMEFMQTPNFIKVFGKVVFESEKWGEGEFIFNINTPKGPKMCILKSRGTGQRMRGINIKNLRPELAIIDDFEDTDDLQDEKQIAKNHRWLFGTFLKAMSKRRMKVIMIGNLIDHNCLLNKVIKLPQWKNIVMGAIKQDGTPLWPDMWSLEELVADFQQYQMLGMTSLWFAEMMNLVVVAEDALIQPEEIYYRPVPLSTKVRSGFITIDPATGDGTDDTAIVVHYLVEDESGNYIPQIVDYCFGKIDELGTVETAIELCYRWGISVIGIESVGYQRALNVLFDMYMKQNGIMGIDIVKTYPANVSKLLRLRSWCALMKSKGYAVTEGEIHLTNALITFDVKKDNNKDDLPDAAAQGQQMIRDHLPLIMSKQQVIKIEAKPVRQSELC